MNGNKKKKTKKYAMNKFQEDNYQGIKETRSKKRDTGRQT